MFPKNIYFCLFSWPSEKINPDSLILGGDQVRVLSVYPNATMETHVLPEIFNIITQIRLPTVIKIEEVNKKEILKALKSVDEVAKKVQVILLCFVSFNRKKG